MRPTSLLAVMALVVACKSGEKPPEAAAPAPAPAPVPVPVPAAVEAAKVEGKTDATAGEGGCQDHTGMQKMVPPETAAVRAFDHKPNPGEKAECPISGEKFEVAADTKVVEHKGRWYALCCDECEPDFKKDPDKYAAK